MFRHLLKPPVPAVLAAVVVLWVAQPALAIIPYGPYGETPGVYDYSSNNNSFQSTYAPAYGETVVPYSRYGETPGVYTYANSSFSGGPYASSSSYTYTPSYTYAAPSYTYAAPSYAFVPSTSSSQTLGLAGADTADRSVHVNMQLPSNAKVYFGDKEMRGSGDYRRFVSPPLTPGEAYTYDIRVTWKDGKRTVEKTRHLRVHAGDKFNLNLARGSRATTTVSTPASGK